MVSVWNALTAFLGDAAILGKQALGQLGTQLFIELPKAMAGYGEAFYNLLMQ